eukprot:scaffold27764_cov40-Prasinocladus_malaysianus.AAC.4
MVMRARLNISDVGQQAFLSPAFPESFLKLTDAILQGQRCWIRRQWQAIPVLQRLLSVRFYLYLPDGPAQLDILNLLLRGCQLGVQGMHPCL